MHHPTDNGKVPAPVGRVWSVVEHQGGELSPVSFELLAEARALADMLQGGGEVCALVLSSEQYCSAESHIDTLAKHGADQVLLACHPALGDYASELHIEVLTDLCHVLDPEIVLLASSLDGQDIAARLSLRTGGSLISDCVRLTVNTDGVLAGSKPVLDDHLYAELHCERRPQVATLRPGACEAKPLHTYQKPEVQRIEPVLDSHSGAVSVGEFLPTTARNLSILEAERVVAGGAGIKSLEGVRLLEALAESLGACSAASRVLVDLGLMPRDKQVGLSGVVVKPKLYLALGISGAAYHLAGMSESEIIIAVNTDPAAEIFKVADFAAIGDLFEVVPALLERLANQQAPQEVSQELLLEAG